MGKATSTEYYTFPFAQTISNVLVPLSSEYITLVAPYNSVSTLTAVLDFSGTTSNAKVKIARKTNTDDYYITPKSLESNRCSIVQLNFGHNTAKEINVISTNSGISGNLFYQIQANLS